LVLHESARTTNVLSATRRALCPMNRNNLLNRHFKPLARKASLPQEARLYTLRHTFATLWMESNEPVKVLQEILGHARIDQTMNTYAHVMPHVRADAFGRFSKRFSQR
jgi:integrase